MPVSIENRDGVGVAAAQWPSVNSRPCRASRSMFGVGIFFAAVGADVAEADVVAVDDDDVGVLLLGEARRGEDGEADEDPEEGTHRSIHLPIRPISAADAHGPPLTSPRTRSST